MGNLLENTAERVVFTEIQNTLFRVLSSTLCLYYDVSCTSRISLVLAMQRNVEIYNNIRRPLRRAHLAVAVRNACFSYTVSLTLMAIIFSVWLCLLLFRCGDINVSPGPASVESLAVRSQSSLSDLSKTLSSNLSILSLTSILNDVKLASTISLFFF